MNGEMNNGELIKVILEEEKTLSPSRTEQKISQLIDYLDDQIAKLDRFLKKTNKFVRETNELLDESK